MRLAKLYQGDMRRRLAELPENSVDSVVCDPPYEIGFDGNDWDSSGIAYDPETWAACMRVLKPGGYLAAFSATRTYHGIARAVQDGGLEIRDMLVWWYLTGFPKTPNAARQIDMKRCTKPGRHNMSSLPKKKQKDDHICPRTEDGKQWDGFSTTLKPTHEPIVLARKPSDLQTADNLDEHGVGALNLKACKLDERWPPNMLISHLPECTPAQCHVECVAIEMARQCGTIAVPHFYYCPKPGVSEREKGVAGYGGLEAEDDRAFRFKWIEKVPRSNVHPTVKPIDLMAWLCRLLTPPGGTVLDPFMGSGSTGVGSLREGFRFIGVELGEKYFDISRLRIKRDAPLLNKVVIVRQPRRAKLVKRARLKR